MKKTTYTILLLVSSLLLSACGEPTFDASDPDVSIMEMTKELSDNDKKAFTKAVYSIALSAGMKGMSQSDVWQMLNGKTVKEIIEMSK